MVTQSDKKKVGKRVGKLFQSVNKMKLPREESSRSADQGLPTVVRQRVLSRARLGELEAYKGHHITAPEERGHLRGKQTEGEASLPPPATGNPPNKTTGERNGQANSNIL